MRIPSIHFKSGPEADWRIILIMFAVFSIALTAFNVFIFFRLDAGIQMEEIPKQNSLDLEKLKETNAYYQNKVVQFEAILRGAATPADPSL